MNGEGMTNIRDARELLKSLSDETRLRILSLLDHHDEVNVGELCQILESSQTMISKHLMRLRLLGLVRDRRKGTNVYYSLAEIREPVHKTIVISVTKSFEEFEIFEEDLKRIRRLRRS
jgi:DNA-binding transcriptional ArsR family regulator